MKRNTRSSKNVTDHLSRSRSRSFNLRPIGSMKRFTEVISDAKEIIRHSCVVQAKKYRRSKKEKENQYENNHRSLHTIQDKCSEIGKTRNHIRSSLKNVPRNNAHIIKEQVLLNTGVEPKTEKDFRFLEAKVNGKVLRAFVDLTSECITLRHREADILNLKIELLPKDSNIELCNFNGSCIRPIGTCEVSLKLDLVSSIIVQLYVVPCEFQNVPLIVGQPYTSLLNVTVIHRHGKLRLFESSVAVLRGLDRLTSSANCKNGNEDTSAISSESKRDKIISFGGLLNQLQPNVRWSSSLKIRDKEALQPDRTFKYADISVRLAAPHELNAKPKVSDLAFGKFFTDHMLKVYYHEALGGWQMPEITPLENLVLHPAAKVLHYAIELFEGMKAYRGVDGKIRVFRPEMNMERMNASAVRSGLPTFNGMELIKCINRLISIDQEWVPHSEASSLYIRPTLIGIDPTLGVATSESALLYVLLSPVGSYFSKSDAHRGVSLLADPRYTRAWPGGCGDRKMGSNYAPTLHVQKEAVEKGLQQVLWLYGEDHQITEAGTMNVFVFFINDQGERELITPPLDGLILPGITRNSILALSKEWNQFKVSERRITMTDVIRLLSENRLLELFGAGTACIVSPVTHIHYMDQNLYLPTVDHAEPIHRVFLKRLTEIQYGYVDHPWAFPIE